jgi:predicted CXXCH cytochrome family protein
MRRSPAIVGLSATVLAAISVVVMAGVKGSKHDFSAEGWSQEQLCLPCHIPHDATATTGAPLWARSADPGRRYVITGQEGLAAVGSASAMCLSCHDGTTASDTFGGATGSVTISNPRAVIGKGGDLSTDHPIGVEYPSADRGFQPTNLVKARGTIQLPGGQVECISCHDVHNQSGFPYMLVEDNKGSNLCLACHNK